MDLDKLKNTWQSAEIKSSIDEQQIQQMLTNKGKSAFNYLLNYEKIGLGVAIILAAISILLLLFDCTTISIYMAVSIPIIGLWQLYKLYFLKQMNIAKMNLLEVSQKVNTYKQYISREWIAAIAWTLSICVLFLYEDTNFIYRVEEASETMFILQMFIKGAITFLFIIGISYIVYKFTLAKNIKKLEESIKEVEEFQRDNKE